MSNMQENDTGLEMERRYCFTEQEFLILASSLGIRSLYGFKPQEPLKTDDKELYQQFFRMTKKGFLDASKEGYLVTPGIRELFYHLKKSDSVITICDVDDSFPEKCIYAGQKFVLIEPGGLKGKYFKCTYDRPERIREMLCENGILFVRNVADDILYDAFPIENIFPQDRALMQLAWDVWDGSSLEVREEMRAHNVRTILEKRDILNDTLQKRMFLAEREIDDVILLQEEESVQLFHYSRQLFLEFLEEWMGEGSQE